MPRILIVDDSPTIRKMVRASLRALESFDFIADVQDSSRELAVSGAAAGFLTKPVDRALLLSTVAGTLEPGA